MTVRGLELESIAINQNTMSVNVLFELRNYNKQMKLPLEKIKK